MKVSVNWLQTFFEKPLPSAEEIAEALTFGVAEIEEIIPKGDDTVIDVNVLPDRACYMLGHRGVAQELSILLDIPMKEDPLKKEVPSLAQEASELSVVVDDFVRCPAFNAALIRGVKVGPSPEWLVQQLEAIGQRSINNVVDATNYVMFTLGTPTHVFDAKKFEEKNGTIGIQIRPAVNGEKITTLGGDEHELTEEMTVVADLRSGVGLSLAGIKGGTVAEVDSGTTDVVLEAAVWNPVRTRRSAQALKLRTDASHRFENGIADMLQRYGIEALANLVLELAGGELVGYAHTEREQPLGFKVGISTSEINVRLGTNFSDKEVQNILTKLGYTFTEVTDPVAKAVESAKKLVGATYKPDSAFRVDAPDAFSCSSLTNYAYVQAGVGMPSISVDQYAWGTPVDEPQVGDLVFSNTGEGRIRTETVAWRAGMSVPEGVDHVGMYLEGGEVLHASRNPGSVVIEKLDESPMFKNVVGYRRVITADEPRFVIDIPFERLDLRSPADIVEEVGRVFGYANIEEAELPVIEGEVQINKTYAYAEKVRVALAEAGFSEVYNYSLSNDGDIALENSLAADKDHLRANLSDALREKLVLNESHAPLLGFDGVCMYEIGNVFTKDAEEVHVSVAVRYPKGKKQGAQTEEALAAAQSAIDSALGMSMKPLSISDETLEWNLSAVLADISIPEKYPEGAQVADGASYTPLSPYPFVLRDIAAWTPEGTTEEQFAELICTEAGDLLVRVDKFDEFSKDGRTSYAFRLVFQSGEKTLTDEEVNVAMDKVYEACNKAGFETR